MRRNLYVAAIAVLLCGVAAAWFSVHVAFLLYMLTPLFFIVPAPPRRVAQGGASDAAETTHR